MAEPKHGHPGFDWIMHNFERLMRDYPSHWVVADRDGFVIVSADQQELFGALLDRIPNELAIIYLDPRTMRASPPTPGALSPLEGGGAGGVVFEVELAGRANSR